MSATTTKGTPGTVGTIPAPSGKPYPLPVPPGWTAVPGFLCPKCETVIRIRSKSKGGLWADVRCFKCSPVTIEEGGK